VDSNLFATLIAVDGIRQVFGAALLTFARGPFFCDGLPAAGTESSMWRQVLAAVGALTKNEQLMAAFGAKFGVCRDGLPTIRASHARGAV
jgi:hypothetical protein